MIWLHYCYCCYCLVLVSYLQKVVVSDIGSDSNENEPSSDQMMLVPIKEMAQRQLLQKDRYFFLSSHNRVRGSTVPPATNMVPLVWSLELERSARNQTGDCSFKSFITKESRHYLARWFFSIGFNNWVAKAVANFNASAVVNQWAEQQENFDFDNLGCTIGYNCMNYAQVVWSSATHVGCSLKFCPRYIDEDGNEEENMFYSICVYGEGQGKQAPNGDYVSPYKKGDVCSDCPSGFWRCNMGLCETETVCDMVVDCVHPSAEENCLCPENFYSVGRRIEVAHCSRLSLAIIACLIMAHHRFHICDLVC